MNLTKITNPLTNILFFLQETGNRAEHVVKIKLDSLVILQKKSYDEDPGKHPANKFFLLS